MKSCYTVSAIVVLIVIGCDLPRPSSSGIPSIEPKESVSEPLPTSPSEALSAPPVDVRILDEFELDGEQWLSVLLPATIQREEFIEIAKWIFRNNKVKKIKWFTSDERYAEYRNSQHNSNSTGDKKTEDWINAHYFGISNYLNNTSWQFAAFNKRAKRFFPSSGGFELQ